MDEGIKQRMIEQVTEAQSRYPNLELHRYPSGDYKVKGSVGFSIDHDSHVIEDAYNLEFRIPDDYPNSPPLVYEREGKIPKDFEHFMVAGNFCLGAPVEVRRRFAEYRNLLRFIDDIVIPYLFTYSYKRDHGKVPFGELCHGTFGLLQYYSEYFGTPAIETMKLLKCLADDSAPPLMSCPCGSRKQLRECHGLKLMELRPHLPPKRFETELREMIKCLRTEGIRFSESKVMPKRLLKQRQRQWRKKNKRKR